jgi:hypothetical protein
LCDLIAVCGRLFQSERHTLVHTEPWTDG